VSVISAGSGSGTDTNTLTPPALATAGTVLSVVLALGPSGAGLRSSRARSAMSVGIADADH
jgi:hypothetical protein